MELKTKTVSVGLFTLIMATLFGVQIWHGLTELYPPLVSSWWANISFPLFGKAKYMLQSLFQALLTFIGIQLSTRGLGIK